MSRSLLPIVLWAAALVSPVGSFFASDASAQMIQSMVPFQSQNNTFYDATGVTWGVRGPGFFTDFGGIGGGAVPPLGGFGPAAGTRAGIGFRNGPWSGNFGLSLNRGSSSSFGSTSASVTALDGYPGSISSQIYRPFVTGFIPVVGGNGVAALPIVGNLPPVDSTGQQELAGIRHSQLADIAQRQRKQYDSVQKKADASFQRGLAAEEKGNLRMARANYQNALQTAQGELRTRIMQRVRARGW